MKAIKTSFEIRTGAGVITEIEKSEYSMQKSVQSKVSSMLRKKPG